jgi:hypothetical protein
MFPDGQYPVPSVIECLKAILFKTHVLVDTPRVFNILEYYDSTVDLINSTAKGFQVELTGSGITCAIVIPVLEVSTPLPSGRKYSSRRIPIGSNKGLHRVARAPVSEVKRRGIILAGPNIALL